MASYELPNEICAALLKAGHTISTQQLSDWHRQGLIPTPQQVSLGRPKGTQTRYPLGTTNQALALALIRQKQGRDLEHAGWLLWIFGYQVSEDVWKRHFIEASQELSNLMKVAIDQIGVIEAEPTISDEAMDAIETVSKERNKSYFFGPIRRSLHKQRYVTLMVNLLEVFVGVFEPSDKLEMRDLSAAKELREIFRKLIEGAKQAASEKNENGLFSISGLELEQMLVQLSGAFAKFRDVPMISAFSDTDLAIGRNELSGLFGGLNELSKTFVSPAGGIPRPLELLQRLLRGLTAKQHASLIFIWLIVRQLPPVAEGLRRLAQSNSR